MRFGNRGAVKPLFVLCVALMALGAIYYYWHKGDHYLVLSDEGITVEAGFTESNEEEAASLLRRYAAAQKIFHKHRGYYARNPADLVVTIDGQLTIIDPDVIIMESTRERDGMWSVYSYIPVEKHATGVINRKTGFLLCAAPNGYADGTAIHTLCVGPTGTVLMKDIGGAAVNNVAEIDGSWKPF